MNGTCQRRKLSVKWSNAIDYHKYTVHWMACEETLILKKGGEERHHFEYLTNIEQNGDIMEACRIINMLKKTISIRMTTCVHTRSLCHFMNRDDRELRFFLIAESLINIHSILQYSNYSLILRKKNKMIDFITLCDYFGTFAFAISGIRLASAKQFDWFGAYVVGVVTAVGGGTVRDILLNDIPFWMTRPSYLIVSGGALLFVIIFRKYVIKLNNTFFIFDAIGLGLFVIVGIVKTLEFGFPIWVAIVMGTITGSFGGMIRDILINEVPLVLRKDIYALACVFGGITYWGCLQFALPSALSQFISAATVFSIRILAVKYHISIPVLRGEE
jgi:uncharacterized membrane protein YeiH